VRCYGSHDWGAKGRTNVIGALAGKDLFTTGLFQTNINTTIFHKWMMESLIPKLPNKSVLIMDNATFHKETQIKQSIEEAGHILLYLPPYSPDLNPIEHKWAEKKTERRKLKWILKNFLGNKVVIILNVFSYANKCRTLFVRHPCIFEMDHL